MRISNSWKEALTTGTLLLTLVVTITDILGVNFFGLVGIDDVLIRFISFIIISCVIVCVIKFFIIDRKKSYKFQIRNIDVTICIRDIFETQGLKIIPFNERFDTVVDDEIISRTSLNGKFLLKNYKNLQNINAIIQQRKDKLKTEDNGKFPLGTVIKYNSDYAFLALTHFDEENNAKIKKLEYEKCLLDMWCNIYKIYEGYDIVLPLIGAGITRFEDIQTKLEIDLLKCMLCTLKDSGCQFSGSITIVVLEDTWEKLNLKDIESIYKL